MDGIIIVGTYPGESLNELKRMGVPIVLVDSYVKDEAFHTIGIEDREGARMATEYLIREVRKTQPNAVIIVNTNTIDDSRMSVITQHNLLAAILVRLVTKNV